MTGWGAQIAKWDFSGLTAANNFGSSPMAATSNDANVMVGGLTRGSGVGTSGTAAAKGWGGNRFTASSSADAISNNEFATFTIVANGGFALSLSDIAIYNIRHSAAGPTTGIWQYRVDAGAFADIGTAIPWGSVTSGTGNDQPAIALAGITALQNLAAGSVVTFRIVTWGGTSTNGTWYLNDQTSGARDLVVNGTAVASGTSEPTTQAVSIAFGNVGASRMDVSWTSGNGAGRLVICRQGSAPGSGPVDGTDYAADPNFAGSGASLGGGMVVFKGTGNAFTLSGLMSNTTYYLQIYEFNGSGAATDYLTAAGAGNPASQTTAATDPAPIAIFHVNDTHARLTPHWFAIPQHGTADANFELVGGAATLATAVLQTRSNNPNSLFLDAGDISEGNPIGDMNGNGAMVQFYNLLDAKLKAVSGRGIDASVVGNHDVRDISYIMNLQNAHYPVISMNVCSNGTHNPFFQPYVTVTVNGTKIGILGYTTADSEVGASVDPIIDVVPCDWTSANSTNIHIADYVKELRNTQGCQIVILLAHIGHTAICVGNSTEAPLLVDDGIVKVPEIAVTGHWHTWAATVWQPAVLNYKTIFTESCSYMKYLGELNVDTAGSYLSATQHVLRCSDFPADPDAASLVASLKTQYNTNAVANGLPKLDDVIGCTAQPLLLDKIMKWWSPDEYPWSGDDSAGEWICDAMQWKAQQVFGTNCDLAMEAGGGVRADVPAGPITYTQIYETFPWNDDLLTLVKMTGQEIVNFITANNCDAALSQGWQVTAHDGVPTNVAVNGAALDLGKTYNVAINNYMYDHPTAGFTYSDPSPQISTLLCRQAIVDYTAQFTAANPMTVPGPRYRLDTEFSGGYRAVVTMMNDADTSPSYDVAFIRLLCATPETLSRRGTPQVPADLLHADGSINRANRLAEAELYRSFLGFKTGALTNGTIIEVWGKNSAYQGNPEFVDDEGVYGDGVEFNIVGYDATLAQPEFAGSIRAFWNDDHKNHYVKFFARKTGANTVVDQDNTSFTVMDVTAYAAKALPGNTGDLLQLTGVPTSENYGLRFRCDTARVAASLGVSNVPPASAIQPITPPVCTNAALTLTATVTPAGADAAGASLLPVADGQVVSGNPTSNYGTNTSMYVQSADSGSYGNERAWLKFDLSTVSSAITGARLKLYCWKASGTDMPVVALGSTNDSWTETGLTWSNQPDVTATQALSTNTLASGVTAVWYTWDVTPFVQSQWNGDKMASLALKAVTESAPGTNSYAFEAREYGSGRPFLELDTLGGPVVPHNVTQVQFFYRFSADGATWGAWTPFQSVAVAPWTASFACPAGNGYYEFYSQAIDDQGTVEPAPAQADAAVHLVAAGSFEDWQAHYFGGPDALSADPNADPDCDGSSNWQEYLAGTVPTNALSVLGIVGLAPQGSNVVVSWKTAGGHTNAVQVSHDLNSGFQDVAPVVVGGMGDTVAQLAVPVSTSNAPAYYRVRLGP